MSDKALRIPEDLARRDFELHVICNSHLDREWTENFQFTRYLTVRFIDELLQIMRQVPEYEFLLDSQTVPLEDYLAVRPERHAELRELVTARRLWIGPWYTAPDCSCISGESIVRNLLIGHQVARAFGHVMKVGYTPFGFGQVSQLPQIYAGFGIDAIWFYRGVTEREVPGVSFRWRGADGTTAFCSRAARYNFYFGVMRRVLKGGGLLERDYDYTSPQLPVHFCDERRSREHAILADSQNCGNLNDVPRLIVDLLQESVKHFPGRVISFMNGMDTSMPTILDDAVLRRAREALPPNWKIFHSNLPRFLEAFRAEVEAGPAATPTVYGERRDAGHPHREAGMLGDIITARPEQKRRSAEAETALQRYAEPLATLAWLLGAEYPARLLNLAWRELCKCHAHDTIAGSGVDQLERDTLNRLDQVFNISEAVQQFAMGDILRHVDNSRLGPEEIPLVVFNPSPVARSEVVSAAVDIPRAFNWDGCELCDATSGSAVESYITSWRVRGERVVRDVYDATTSFYCVHATLDFVAADIPPLGYRTFILRKAERKGWCRTLLGGPTTLENEFLRAQVTPDGLVDLFAKKTQRSYPGLHYFRDRGEAGNAWTSCPPMQDRVVLSTGAPTRISVEHNSPLKAVVKVEKVLRVPAGQVGNDDFTFTRRSDELVDLPITSWFTLTATGRALDVRTVIENRAENHTLQVFFPTHIPAQVSVSDTACDVVARGIDRDAGHSYAQVVNPTHPCLTFADVSDGQVGLAVAAVGVRGYEVTDDAARALGLTLLRAFEIYLCTVSWRWERRPDQKLSQALGRHEVSYALVPHAGDWRHGVPAEAERINVPLLIVQTGRHAGELPPCQALLAIEPAAVQISALKKAEERDAAIVRVFNPTDEAVTARLRFFRPIRSARLVSLEEVPLSGGELAAQGGEVYFAVGPKKIVTLELS